MKAREKKDRVYPPSKDEPAVLNDSLIVGGAPAVTVREAKAHLSALLDWVAKGHAVTITSDGRPKARLVAAEAGQPRKVFGGAQAHLANMPSWTGGPTGEEVIRQDRDGRGW